VHTRTKAKQKQKKREREKKQANNLCVTVNPLDMRALLVRVANMENGKW